MIWEAIKARIGWELGELFLAVAMIAIFVCGVVLVGAIQIGRQQWKLRREGNGNREVS